jgi:hypothetical protein
MLTALPNTNRPVMALPLSRLLRLRVRLTQKINVGIIFCLSFVVVGVEIVRLVESLKHNGTNLNIVWTSSEASVAVIISCLPTYNTLISYREKARSRATTAYDRLAASRAITNKTQSARELTVHSNKSNNDDSQGIPLDDYPRVYVDGPIA